MSRLEPHKRKLAFGAPVTIAVAPSGTAVIIAERKRDIIFVGSDFAPLVRSAIKKTREPHFAGRFKAGVFPDKDRDVAVFVDATSGGNRLCFGVVERGASVARSIVRLDADDVAALERALDQIEPIAAVDAARNHA